MPCVVKRIWSNRANVCFFCYLHTTTDGRGTDDGWEITCPLIFIGRQALPVVISEPKTDVIRCIFSDEHPATRKSVAKVIGTTKKKKINLYFFLFISASFIRVSCHCSLIAIYSLVWLVMELKPATLTLNTTYSVNRLQTSGTANVDNWILSTGPGWSRNVWVTPVERNFLN